MGRTGRSLEGPDAHHVDDASQEARRADDLHGGLGLGKHHLRIPDQAALSQDEGYVSQEKGCAVAG